MNKNTHPSVIEEEEEKEKEKEKEKDFISKLFNVKMCLDNLKQSNPRKRFRGCYSPPSNPEA